MYKIKDEELIYPELYLSDEIKQIIIQNPQKPIDPILPQKPVEPSDYEYIGCFSYLLIIPICSGFMYLSSLFCDAIDASDGVYVFFAFVSLIISGLIVVYFLYNYQDGLSNNAKARYQKDLERYSQALKEYENDRLYFMIRSTNYYSDINDLKKYRRNLLSNYLTELKQRNKYNEINGSDRVKKGNAEIFFYNYLKEYCDNEFYKISIDVKVSVGNSYFYPDLIIESNDGILFDIEIDEPYSHENGSPIHYLEPNIQKSIDHQRNRFFQRNEWVVIRFAESQIYSDPYECAVFIYKVNALILKNDIESLNVPLSFVIDKWDYQQATVFFKNKYRQTYIPR